MEAIKATKIGLGVESSRKLVGLMWFYAERQSSGGRIYGHTNSTCSRVDLPRAARLPVYEENGVETVELRTPRGGLENVTVERCRWCPPVAGDTSWTEWAQCKGQGDLAFTEDPNVRAEFIKGYCEVCPVQLECLEYGALDVKGNSLAVWGGVYFYKDRHATPSKVEAKRKELENA